MLRLPQLSVRRPAEIAPGADDLRACMQTTCSDDESDESDEPRRKNGSSRARSHERKAHKQRKRSRSRSHSHERKQHKHKHSKHHSHHKRSHRKRSKRHTRTTADKPESLPSPPHSAASSGSKWSWKASAPLDVSSSDKDDDAACTYATVNAALAAVSKSRPSGWQVSPHASPSLGPRVSPMTVSAAHSLAAAREQILQRRVSSESMGAPISPGRLAAAASPRAPPATTSPRHGPTMPPPGFWLGK